VSQDLQANPEYPTDLPYRRVLDKGFVALIDVMGTRPGLDATSLCHVLCLGYVPALRTIWEGVGKLGPGRMLRWSPEEGIRVETHWRPADEIGDAEPEFGAVWEQVVEEHLLSDVPVGLFLSGGLDSTCVAMALARLGRTDVTALTLDIDGPDSEASAGAAVAAHLGLEHASIPFGAQDAWRTLLEAAEAYDEPQAYGALLTATRLARAARERGTVMLAGDGGDEAFAGYAWHRSAPARRPPDERHDELARRVREATAEERERAAALDALATLSPLHAHLQRVFPRFHPSEASALFGEVAQSRFAALANSLGARPEVTINRKPAEWWHPHPGGTDS